MDPRISLKIAQEEQDKLDCEKRRVWDEYIAAVTATVPAPLMKRFTRFYLGWVEGDEPPAPEAGLRALFHDLLDPSNFDPVGRKTIDENTLEDGGLSKDAAFVLLQELAEALNGLIRVTMKGPIVVYATEFEDVPAEDADKSWQPND